MGGIEVGTRAGYKTMTSLRSSCCVDPDLPTEFTLCKMRKKNIFNLIYLLQIAVCKKNIEKVGS